MKEADIHDLIIKDDVVKRAILSALQLPTEDYTFIHEDQYPNNIYADFTILIKNKVRAIVEIKGSDIGVNDFIRGLGQISQYQNFADRKISIKGYKFENAKAVYLLPSSIFTNKTFNIGLFSYPDKSELLEINEVNKSVRIISANEREKISKAQNETISISQYYIRDTRLYELYLALRYCNVQMFLGCKEINRKNAEIFLRKLDTANNQNWRNVFISLSSLGLIDSNNIPTSVGTKYSAMPFADFCYEMYASYIHSYIDEIMEVLVKLELVRGHSFDAKNNDIKEMIKNKYDSKDILFLTESENRYISSWLNIMRDDFNCIDFESRSSLRTIQYNISELKKEAIIGNINGARIKPFLEKLEALLLSKKTKKL